MRSRAKRSVLRWAVIALACLVGSVCLWRVVGSNIRYRRVERAIGQFERNPSRASVGALAELLENYTATNEQGSRILTLLCRPTITTRSTYAAGRSVWVALERPFHSSFRGTWSWRDELRIVEAGEKHVTRRGRPPATLYFNGLLADQAKPGIHRLTVRGACSVAFRRRGGLSEAGHWAGDLLRKMGLSPGENPSPDRTYKCEFEMPFEVTVVPRDQAETIELVSSARLDNAMEDALQLGSSPRLGSHPIASGQIQYYASEVIGYRDLPVSVVFQVRLHLSDEPGRATVLEDPQPFVAKAGTSGQRSVSCRFTRPGTYTGTIILHPDLSAAYKDPSIKAIWGETLEFPVSFTIVEKPSDPQKQTETNEARMAEY